MHFYYCIVLLAGMTALTVILLSSYNEFTKDSTKYVLFLVVIVQLVYLDCLNIDYDGLYLCYHILSSSEKTQYI